MHKWYCNGCSRLYIEGDVLNSTCAICMEKLIKKSQDVATEDGATTDNPKYYQKIVKELEAIEVIEEVLDNYKDNLDPFKCYCLGNALKYILRGPTKFDQKLDLKKASWYLQRITND